VSDHKERACSNCGSLLHHEDNCDHHPVSIGNAAFHKSAKEGKGSVVAWIAPKAFGFDWCLKGRGFGQISILLKDPKIDEIGGCPQGSLRVESECMSREFVKKIICQAIDEAEFPDE